MDEAAGTTGTPVAAVPSVDETARFRALAGFGLALTSLLGGGVFSTAFQSLAIRVFDQLESERLYLAGFAASPLVMALVALGLATAALGSDDPVARPLARATGVVGVLAVLGSVLLLAVTIDTP